MISVFEAKQATGSVESMYYGLILAGYYLPTIHSSGVTAQYFLKVATKKCFGIESKKVHIGQLLKSATKDEILFEIRKKLNNQDLGFSEGDFPDKASAVNILKTIDPNHQLFKNPKMQDVSILTQDDLALIRQLDTSIGRNKRLRYFRRTKEQVQQMKEEVQKKKHARKELVHAKKLLKLSKLTEELTMMGEGIQEEGQQVQQQQQ